MGTSIGACPLTFQSLERLAALLRNEEGEDPFKILDPQKNNEEVLPVSVAMKGPQMFEGPPTSYFTPSGIALMKH